MDQLTPAELALAKLSKAAILLREAGTVLCIENVQRRAALRDDLLHKHINAIVSIEEATVKVLGSLAQAQDIGVNVPLASKPTAELNDVAKDVISALENLGEKPKSALAFVTAAVDRVGSADFNVLFSETMKMVRQ